MKKIILLLTGIALIGTSKAQVTATSKKSNSTPGNTAAPRTHSSGSSNSGVLKMGWGDLNKNEKKLEPVAIFGDMKNGIYMIKTQGDKHTFLAKYTGNLSQTFEKELVIPTPPEAEGSKFVYKECIYIKGHIYLVSTYKNKADKTDYLLFYSVSPDGIVSSSMHEMDKKVGGEQKTPGMKGKAVTKNLEEVSQFGTILSHDSTKILIEHEEMPINKENTHLSFKVVDAGLKTIWSKTIELPYPNKEFELSGYRVDNEGNIVFVGKKELKGDEKTGKAKIDYRLFTYYWKEDKLKEYTFDLGDNVIDNVYFTFDTTDNIMAAGFYSNKNNSSKVDGYFYSFIDRKSETVTEKIVKDLKAEFTGTLESQHEKNDKLSNKKGELQEMTFDHIYPSPNGNLILVAEQYWRQEVTVVTNNGGMMSTYTYFVYHANDIVTMSLKPNGTVNWITDIPKKQQMNNTSTYISYLFDHYDNNVYFIYNDNPKNFNSPKEKLLTYANTKKTGMYVVTVDGDGKMTKKEISQPDNDNHLAIITDFGGYIGDGIVALLARYKNYYRVGIASAR